jgi:class 3 adenylate cyclase
MKDDRLYLTHIAECIERIESYVDTALVPMREKLAALEAQQHAADQQLKYVTILFTDVTGSTQMGQRLDPEETMAVMDGALRRFNAIIEQHGCVDRSRL